MKAGLDSPLSSCGIKQNRKKTPWKNHNTLYRSISSLIGYTPPCSHQKSRLLLHKDVPVLKNNSDNSNYLHEEIKFLPKIQIPIFLGFQVAIMLFHLFTPSPVAGKKMYIIREPTLILYSEECLWLKFVNSQRSPVLTLRLPNHTFIYWKHRICTGRNLTRSPIFHTGESRWLILRTTWDACIEKSYSLYHCIIYFYRPPISLNILLSLPLEMRESFLWIKSKELPNHIS